MGGREKHITVHGTLIDIRGTRGFVTVLCGAAQHSLLTPRGLGGLLQKLPCISPIQSVVLLALCWWSGIQWVSNGVDPCAWSPAEPSWRSMWGPWHSAGGVQSE